MPIKLNDTTVSTDKPIKFNDTTIAKIYASRELSTYISFSNATPQTISGTIVIPPDLQNTSDGIVTNFRSNLGYDIGGSIRNITSSDTIFNETSISDQTEYLYIDEPSKFAFTSILTTYNKNDVTILGGNITFSYWPCDWNGEDKTVIAIPYKSTNLYSTTISHGGKSCTITASFGKDRVEHMGADPNKAVIDCQLEFSNLDVFLPEMNYNRPSLAWTCRIRVGTTTIITTGKKISFMMTTYNRSGDGQVYCDYLVPVWTYDGPWLMPTYNIEYQIIDVTSVQTMITINNPNTLPVYFSSNVWLFENGFNDPSTMDGTSVSATIPAGKTVSVGPTILEGGISSNWMYGFQYSGFFRLGDDTTKTKTFSEKIVCDTRPTETTAT